MTPAVTALREAADRIERLEAQQAAVLALHRKHRWKPDCYHCGWEYPCPTRRALTEDTP